LLSLVVTLLLLELFVELTELSPVFPELEESGCVDWLLLPIVSGLSVAAADGVSVADGDCA
jgi:hypothetical protein